MGYRLVRDVPSIQPNGFSVEEVGHSLVGRIRVAQRAGRQKQPGSKVFTEFAFRAEAHTEAGPVAIQARSAILKDAFAAQSDVAAEPEPAQYLLQRDDFFILILALAIHDGKRRLGFHRIG